MKCNQGWDCGAPHAEGESCYCPCHAMSSHAIQHFRDYRTYRANRCAQGVSALALTPSCYVAFTFAVILLLIPIRVLLPSVLL